MSTFLKITIRSLQREKLYALINIAGLALAIACCIVLALYLRSELTYDRHHENHSRIYRLVNEYSTGANPQRLAVTSPVIAPMMSQTYPEIETHVRFLRAAGQGNMLITHDADSYYWDHVYAVDTNVFDVFTHEAVYGDLETAFADQSTVALSETVARRYFADENPIGETLRFDNGQQRRVSAVFEDLPANTHLKYDVLIPLGPQAMNPANETMRAQQLWNLGNFIYSYFVMPEDYDVEEFAVIADDFFERYMAGLASTLGGNWTGWLQPLADIHLSSGLIYDRPTGNIYYLFGFATVAVFILLVACINYVNLATARATRRTRSVGLRKILGARQSSLVFQFLSEAVIYSLIATVLALALVEVALSVTPLESLLGAQIEVDIFSDPVLAAGVIGAGLLIGLLAGLYPAFYLAGWAPLTALVSTSRSGQGGFRFRQLLVFAQFAISIAVIASALLMAAQMRFIQNRSLGFNPENRVMVTLRGTDLIRQAPAIMSDLSNREGVLGVATSTIMMGQDLPSGAPQVETNLGVMEPFNSGIMIVGEDFIDVMDLRIEEGRNFSTRLLTDVGSNFLVNREFVNDRGWDEAIGKRVNIGNANGRVVGVVENFNFKSLHEAIEPIAIMLQPELGPNDNQPTATRILVVNIAGDAVAQTLSDLESLFAEVDPTHPFEFRFVDDFLDSLYVSEQSLTRLVGVFAAICISIACLGLYGLAAFTTEQRTREIGIRKVLGATGSEIVIMLSRNILLLVLAGAVVASLGAFFAMDLWLENFAYRTAINPLVFVLATGIALAIAFATVSLQASGAIRRDPVEALRYE